MKHLLTKVEHLTLGANMDVCLEKMREQAYFVQSQERAEERNKPTWLVDLHDISNMYGYNVVGTSGFHFLRKK